jgi:hypothetical protein
MDGSTRLDRLSSLCGVMDLFRASGIDLPRSGDRPLDGAVAPRSLRVLLFAHKVVQERAALMPRGGKPSFHRLSPVNDVRSVDHVGETDKTRFRGCG